MLLRERFERQRPLEAMEVALVRASLATPSLIDAHEEAILRTAISLARLYKVPHEGRSVGVGAFLAPFRDEVARRLGPIFLDPKRPPTREALKPHIRDLKERALATRDDVAHRFRERVPYEAFDREIRHKALVLVMGGGGGTAYVYVGAMAALDELGVAPSLLVGTSMGAILALFRARQRRFDQDEIIDIVRTLSWRTLFRAISTENRYGVPAALRLYLRAGIGRWFGINPHGGEGVKLSELAIPTIVAACGIRRGKLPHPLEFYERLISPSPTQLLNPLVLPGWFSALWEFASNPDIMAPIHLGADAATSEFDAIDAAGFSSALPGIIHYDVLRPDARMHGVIGGVLESNRISRFVDGGLVDNLPARAAWKAVHTGRLGTRNAFILGLNGFATKLSTPLWLPLQRLAEINVTKNRPWAHVVHDFKLTLGALTVVPTVTQLLDAMEMGRAQLRPELPFLARMLAPLPRL